MELHPSGFVETGQCSGCDGPRYIPIQPSRETPGILLADKYIAEFDKMDNENGPDKDMAFSGPSVDFNLPFRNSIMYSKQLQNNWTKLDQEQQSYISSMISNIGVPTVSSNKQLKSGSNKQMNFANLRQDGLTSDNIGEHLDSLYEDPQLQKGLKEWSMKKFHEDPMNVTLCVFIIILFLGLGFGCGFYYK